MGAAQVFAQAFPATATEDAVDALDGTFGVFGFGLRCIISIVGIPVLAPFVNVAGHVKKTVAVGRIGHDGGCVGAEEIGLAAFDIGSGRIEACEAAFGCDFPFGFGGKAFADPFGISNSAVPSDTDDRMLGIARFDVVGASAFADA